MSQAPAAAVTPPATAAPPPANVRIESVRIKDFRALAECCVTLEAGTTLLLGENNTGKTSLLQALATALGQRRAVDDDLRVPLGSTAANEFVVDLTVVPGQGTRFEGPVGTVMGNGLRRDAHDREYVAIRTIGTTSADRGALHLRRHFLDGWSSCSDNPADAAEIAGASPVTDRVLGVLAFTLLDASRDLETELRQRLSHWGRLVAKLDIDPALQATIESSLGTLGQQIITGSTVLATVRKELDATRKALATVSGVELAPLPTRIDELARGIDVLVTAPDGPPLPLRMQGLGSRSLAAILVFRAFAATLIGADRPIAPQPVTAFEEPEAHLHPQAQIAVARLIDDLPGQRLVSTHSAHLASVADIAGIRFLRRGSTGITVHAVTGLDPEDTIKVRRLVERPYGEVLFARLVIIGDGATERAGLPVFARAHWDGIECEGKGVSIVDPGSLGSAGPLVKVLEDLAIPWLLFVDGDPAGATALTTIGNRISRTLDDTSPEVVRLPAGQAWEEHLLAEGLVAPMEQGIAACYGAAALTTFAAQRNNATLSPEDLVRSFLQAKKGSHGGPLAEAIVAVTAPGGRPTIPTKVGDLLTRADQTLAAP